jgi:galactokinase
MNINDIHQNFERLYHRLPAVLVRAPGRVNLLGEHVDYNDGFVLPAAIDREVRIAAAPTTDGTVCLHALDLKQSASFRLEDVQKKIDLHGKDLPGWARYPAGVAWSLAEAGFPVGGLQAVFTSDIPMGSGLSSSAAEEVGFAAAWEALEGWSMARMELARLCQRAENRYVGVNCGIMDQFASACGKKGHALFFDTRSLDWEPAPIPAGIAIVIADSGVRRSLTHSGYNDRRAACEQAVRELQKFMPNIHSLRDVSTPEFAAYSPYLSEVPRKRAEHVVKEIGRVRSALSALQRSDKQALGALMYAGHNSLRNLYEVSTPELDTLVELSRGLPGCIGARLTGAGFGGCTVNLVESEHAGQFIEQLKYGYTKETGRQAQVYLCYASDGVGFLE